jgi:hypothetical protein
MLVYIQWLCTFKPILKVQSLHWPHSVLICIISCFSIIKFAKYYAGKLNTLTVEKNRLIRLIQYSQSFHKQFFGVLLLILYHS